ncbi:class I SAM-dependent methyltransferase [Streptomyces sp. SL13]|jgi:O-methyltransferase|uniref:Class I SAM-dependent methyltransferase n=1 Tax=Streptantibioticus silvisoli TaxID=2705255 RepID=A0AA90H1W9_9ACTN|nr:class I SAM-dependent methyltransferase [Streptantibioticus silvisoli]MDI5963480.1 class I SAM-dependent methyltransferase [Streptantibioticus silvisoli]MDI5969349.1 class I SAM-dependent methyltransferase [Streptantibioticus silvisoli]
MAQQINANQELLDYVRATSLRDDEVLAGLRAETATVPAARVMQVMPEEGQLLALLVGLTGARAVLEIGTFTGYSTLCMARALPADGRLVTCDLAAKWPDMGRPFWQEAGVADRIEVRAGDARATLAALREEGAEFDFVFIDADKSGYLHYYEESLSLLRPGGLIVVDNTLFFGRVADPAVTDIDTVAVRALNTRLHTDERVEICLLPMADGITLVRKK